MTRSGPFAKSALILLLVGSEAAWAQSSPGPKGMYCGGNEIVQYSRPIRARNLTGTVFDQSGATIAAARIQVQRQGSETLILDITADENGRFLLPKLEGVPTGWAYRNTASTYTYGTCAWCGLDGPRS